MIILSQDIIIFTRYKHYYDLKNLGKNILVVKLRNTGLNVTIFQYYLMFTSP